ncbi:MAG: TlyA family RNA methyltransferase [Burkholderiaceae bacterium]|jgi:23S rRNA (cytidine1920-2'-O)/16S rRNA (cytidine1409-2'-O)-methyltransferase|nr:TlyA family RNA methyltransferase [Burkholderiaceae bacterium]MCU0927763.1 TlyA family RNA methyltransferase [Burkholderiaceae bacterium]
MRADRLLVSQGLAPTRSAAQRLIASGAVRWRGPSGWTAPRKAGDELPEGCEVQLVDDAELRWVSRGGLKLDGALVATGLDVRGSTCLDVGQSTGGFTDVLLARGAALVVGVDVGHGQLHPRLQADERVRAFEGVNARSLDAGVLGDAMPPQGFDLVTGDLSFISLTLVLPALAPLVAPGGDLLLLVKPQFELQPAQLGKGGLVKDPALHATVRERVEAACHDAGLVVQRWLESPVRGGDGNVEWFVWARPAREGS